MEWPFEHERVSGSARVAFVALVALSSAAALGGLYYWFTLDPMPDLGVSLPGRDGRPAQAESGLVAVDLAGAFETFDGVPSALAGAWPRFRGADFDNIYKGDASLSGAWGESGPPVLWTVEALGEGHAAPVVLDGRVYFIDYDEGTRADAIRCLSLDDGREIWRHSYPVSMKRNHGMSRTVPAVTPEYLVTMGPRCHVVCLDAKTGGFRWGIDLQRAYGTTEPLWYTGQCPLVDGGLAILAPAGPEALLMAVDCETGEVRWTTPNPDGLIMSHSSVMPLRLAGTRMYVYAALGAVVGVGAEGAEMGQLLWQVPWNARVAAPSPVAVGEDRVFLAAGYGFGGMLISVRREGDGFAAEVLDQHSPKDGLAAEQQSAIYHAGLLYGIMPKDAGGLRGQFVCYHPDGHLVWSSGQDNRYGLGPFILADGKFYVLSDDGVLTVIEASTEAFVPLGQARILDGHDAWGPIALAGSRMLLRDSRTMVCIELGANAEASEG